MRWHDTERIQGCDTRPAGFHSPLEAVTVGRGGRLPRPRALAPRDPRAPPPVLDAIAGSMLVHFLRAPALVGGIVPSSPVLTRAMARQAAGYEAIVELGAGTGAVTRRLADEHPRAALTVIEREASLARRLAQACRHARIRIGCVHERAADLLAQPASTVAVSSLPFRSLPDDVAAMTVATLERFLLAYPARRLVQYSYGLRVPFAFADARLHWRRVERVWRNVPPAVVWIAGLQV
ncbi:MAG TPA: methyltransferase domain-containing protein [Casimicrobiaceae bacterium]|nr:methyltransferase domain-containing protein [Casimicrobiaceae bacterium]